MDIQPNNEQNMSAPDSPQSLEGRENEEVKSLDDDNGKGGKKKILYLLVPLILITAIGTGLYLSGMLDSFMGSSENADEPSEQADKEERPVDPGSVAFLAIPDMVVNLSSDNGQPRFLRLSVQLELESPEDAAAVEAVLPRVIDQFQTYLRELRVEDLRGSKGIYRLQVELLSRVNAAAYPTKVKDVLFQEILIQ